MMLSVKGILNSIRKIRKRSFSETLEDIDDNIAALENRKVSSISSAKKIAFRITFFGAVFYGTGLLSAYFFVRPSSTYGKVLFYSSALVYPFLILLLKYVFTYLYLGSADSAERKLKDLKKRKAKILSEIMETQTYNRANQLLRRFDPLGIFQAEHMTPIPSSGLQQKETGDSSVVNRRPGPFVPQVSLTKTPQTQVRKVAEDSSKFSLPPKPPPTPNNVPVRHRPILPRERSVLDKVLDALVGDGPDRRYALICRRCASHNGMALAEEFEFLAFKCCYCDFFNPARRVRRNSLVPKLETFPSPTAGPTPFTTSSSSTLRSRRVYSASLANLNASETPGARMARQMTASEENVFEASTTMQATEWGSLSHLSSQPPLSRLVEDSPPTDGSPTPPRTLSGEVEEDAVKPPKYEPLEDEEEEEDVDKEQTLQNSPDHDEVLSGSVFHD
nr:unnamed protein product [Spirometra erinaceieuropaei]